jgi:hypothetical protein
MTVHLEMEGAAPLLWGIGIGFLLHVVFARLMNRSAPCGTPPGRALPDGAPAAAGAAAPAPGEDEALAAAAIAAAWARAA